MGLKDVFSNILNFHKDAAVAIATAYNDAMDEFNSSDLIAPSSIDDIVGLHHGVVSDAKKLHSCAIARKSPDTGEIIIEFLACLRPYEAGATNHYYFRNYEWFEIPLSVSTFKYPNYSYSELSLKHKVIPKNENLYDLIQEGYITPLNFSLSGPKNNLTCNIINNEDELSYLREIATRVKGFFETVYKKEDIYNYKKLDTVLLYLRKVLDKLGYIESDLVKGHIRTDQLEKFTICTVHYWLELYNKKILIDITGDYVNHLMNPGSEYPGVVVSTILPCGYEYSDARYQGVMLKAEDTVDISGIDKVQTPIYGVGWSSTEISENQEFIPATHNTPFWTEGWEIVS